MSNKSYVQKGKLTLLSLFAVAIGGLISCSSPVDSILKNVPVAPAGNQNFTINALRVDGQAVTEFTLAVTGPDTSFTSSFTSTPVVLSNVTSGAYAVTISQTGFIGKTKSKTLDVPTDASTDFEATMDIRLTKRNDPVNIDDAGGTITVPPMGNGGPGVGSSASSISIPAGAVPAGTTQAISATPVPVDPEDPEVSENGTIVFSMEFEPDGLEFNSPITLTIPLDLPQAYLDNNIPVVFEYPNTGETVNVEVSDDGTTGTVQITHFSVWRAASGIDVTYTNVFKTKNYSSECGGGINENYTLTGRIGNVLGAQLGLSSDARNLSHSVPVSIAGVDLFIQTASARQRVYNYVVTTKSGRVLERVNNLPLKAGSATYAAVECHDSGG